MTPQLSAPVIPPGRKPKKKSKPADRVGAKMLAGLLRGASDMACKRGLYLDAKGGATDPSWVLLCATTGKYLLRYNPKTLVWSTRDETGVVKHFGEAVRKAQALNVAGA